MGRMAGRYRAERRGVKDSRRNGSSVHRLMEQHHPSRHVEAVPLQMADVNSGGHSAAGRVGSVPGEGLGARRKGPAEQDPHEPAVDVIDEDTKDAGIGSEFYRGSRSERVRTILLENRRHERLWKDYLQIKASLR